MSQPIAIPIPAAIFCSDSIIYKRNKKNYQQQYISGAEVSGPIPLPTRKEIITILRSPHKHKDSREQFEIRTHKRVIDVMTPNQATVDALMAIDMPAGVEIEVKL